MDFQYHICMIKPRLYDLALGRVWQPCSAELVSIYTTNPVGHERASCMVFYFYAIMHACGFFIVMGLLFVTANRALLENNNILTWLQGFQVKI